MWYGWVLFGALIGVSAAHRRGFGVAGGVIGGLLLGPLAVLMFFASSNRIRCPHCQEWINKKATVCSHCQRDVHAAPVTAPQSQLPTPQDNPPSSRPEEIEPDYLAITREFLAGSGLDTDALVAISEAAKRHDQKALQQALGEGDFLWPWFDRAADQFRLLKQWPELPAWSWFESEPDFYTDKTSVLAKLNGDTLKVIAQKAGVELDAAARVGDIRALLASVLTARQIKPYANALNKKVLEHHQKKAAEAKRVLLDKSIGMRAFNMTRHQQVSYLYNHNHSAEITWDGDLPRFFAKGFRFVPGNMSRLPPFYPGDDTSFRAIRSTNSEPDALPPTTSAPAKKPNRKLLWWLIPIAVVVLIANFVYRLSSPSSPSRKTEIQEAEFRTLSACMASLNTKLGSQLSIIIDEPDNVSGKQSNGVNWACSQKHTGTKGIYWEGWYEVRK
jgi:hypothetical protein